MSIEQIIELIQTTLPYEAQGAKLVFRNEGIGYTEVTGVEYNEENNTVELIG